MSSSREQILDFIVRWEDAQAQGRSLSPEELCGDDPALAAEFRRQLDRLRQVDWLNGPVDSADPADDPASDRALNRLMAGRYRLDTRIGEGGFGRVYKGFDTWLDRPVALKVPRIDRPVTEPETDQCRLEARKVARLHHPHIVPVHDVGREGATCFIVSEWIDGVNLQTRMREDRPSPGEAARIVAEVAGALHHAHALGYVHRDVKPANILLDAQGRAYLTDFGIAVVGEELLRDAGIAGTLPYMAPEQLADGLGPVDHRADIYALGVVFYELLTGRRPFHAPSEIALRDEILREDPVSPRAFNPAIPPELDRICMRCLERRPEDRYPRADWIAEELVRSPAMAPA